MKTVKKGTREKEIPKFRPATSPEDQENRMIALSMDLVEERLRNGTATSQETTHFLKLGSTNARLEHERLVLENELLKAKTEALQSQKRVEELYEEALRSMKIYSGQIDEEDEFDD